MDKYRTMDLNLFVVFDALLRYRSVSKAARELGRSQSAISHALNRLRGYFGDDLFIKSHDGVIPTERALSLREAVESFVAHADQALLRSASFDPAKSSRRITLAVNDIGELATVPLLMPSIQREAPHCSVTTVERWGDDLEEMLSSGAVDIAVSGPLKMSANILQQKLYNHGYHVMVSGNCPLESKISLDQFAAMRHVVASPTSSYRFTTDGVLERQGLRRKAVVSTTHALTIPHVVELSPDYVAVVSKRLADIYCGPFNLKLLQPDFELPSLEVFQYFHRRAKTDPFSIWLRGLVYRVLHRHPLLEVEPEAASPVHDAEAAA